MSRRRLLAAIAVVVAIAVVTPVAPATADTTRTSTPGAVISAYYDSGQWSKAIAAVVKKAKANLKKDLSSSTAPRHPAIVLDIDETAVFNAPCLEPVDWDLSGLATCAVTGQGTVTPVLSLYKYARKKDVRVVMITGRREALAGVTKQLLTSLGYSSGFQLVLRPASDTRNSVVPYKSGARAVVERRGFTILANVGDQRSDLAGGHAKRGYKLPNPAYLIT
jgi:predicted secreted acid phosphatase